MFREIKFDNYVTLKFLKYGEFSEDVEVSYSGVNYLKETDSCYVIERYHCLQMIILKVDGKLLTDLSKEQK